MQARDNAKHKSKMSVVETFLNSPTFEALNKLKKDSIIDVATALGLEPKRTMRKPKLVRIVAEHMVDNETFEEDVLDDLVSESPRFVEGSN